MAVNIYLSVIVDRIRYHVLIKANELYGVVWSQLKEIHAMKGEVLPGWKVTIHKLKHGKTQLRFRPQPNRQIGHLEIGTTAGKQRYLQLDLSPSKFAPGEFEALQKVIADFLEPFSYDKLFYSVPVSYLELAFDSLSHPMASFIPFRTRTFSTYVHPLKSGKGASYLGARSGKLRYCIYDKRKHIEEKLKQKPKHKLQTRIEARIHGTGLMACALEKKLPNIFRRLEIADLKKLLTQFQHPKLSEFLNDCYEMGSGRALEKLSEKDRRRFLLALRKAKASWWNPSRIWNGLPGALMKIAPPSSA